MGLFSVSKILVLIVIIAVVWYGFKFIARRNRNMGSRQPRGHIGSGRQEASDKATRTWNPAPSAVPLSPTPRRRVADVMPAPIRTDGSVLLALNSRTLYNRRVFRRMPHASTLGLHDSIAESRKFVSKSYIASP